MTLGVTVDCECFKSVPGIKEVVSGVRFSLWSLLPYEQDEGPFLHLPTKDVHLDKETLLLHPCLFPSKH